MKRFVGLAGASLLQTGALTLLSLMLAKVLSAHEFGITRTVSNYLIFLSMLGHFCVHDAVAARAGAAATKEEQSRFVQAAIVVVLGSSCLVSVLAELTIAGGNFWTGGLKHALGLSVRCLPLICLTIVLSSVLQAIGNIRHLAFVVVASGATPLCLILSFSYAAELNGWLVGRALSFSIVLLISLAFLRRCLSFSAPFRELLGPALSLLVFARLQLGSGIMSMLIQCADLIFLERHGASMESIAGYSMAALFTRSAMLFPTALGRLYFRDIARAGPDSALSKMRQLLGQTIAICAVIAVAVRFLVPTILNSVYGDKYSAAYSVLDVMVYGIILNGVWGAISVVNVALSRPGHSLVVSAVGFVVCVVGLWFLVPTQGVVGAALAMNLAYLAGVGAGLFLMFSPALGHGRKTS